MRPVEYDVHVIIEAGKDLEAEGRPVTGYALRKRVGGGSADRLRATWDHWVATQGTNDGSAGEPLPAEIVDRIDATSKKLSGQLTALVAELHGRLHEMSTHEIEANNEQARLRERDLRNELADAADTLRELEQRATAAEAKVETFQRELMTATVARQTAEMQYAEVVAQKTTLQAAARDAEAQRRTLEAERNDALLAASMAREELATSHGKLSAMQQQITELLERVGPRARPE